MEKFSYSKVDTYNQCPFKYYLKYKLGNYISADSVAASYGCLIHKINELQTLALLGGKPIDYEELKTYFQEVNIPKKNKFDHDGDIFGTKVLARKFSLDWATPDKTGRSYAVKAQQFLDSGIYRQEEYLREHPELELVGAEIGFTYFYRSHTFSGRIDRLLRYRDNPDHFVIHDLKTSTEAYKDEDIKSPLQFYIYTAALRQRYGAHVLVDCFYEFPVAEVMKQGGSRGWEKRCQKKLDSILNSIEAQDWTPKSGPLCKWCDYSNTNQNIKPEAQNLCPYYSLWSPQNPVFTTKMEWLGMGAHEQQMKKFLILEEEEGQVPLTAKKFDFDF